MPHTVDTVLIEKQLAAKLQPAYGETTKADFGVCKNCGVCCSNTYIDIGLRESDMIAEKTKLPKFFIGKTNEGDIPGTKVISLHHKYVNNKPVCYFYTGNSCKLHANYGVDSKPLICRTFPFFGISRFGISPNWGDDRDNAMHDVFIKLRQKHLKDKGYTKFDVNVSRTGNKKKVSKLYLAQDPNCRAMKKGNYRTDEQILEILELSTRAFFEHAETSNLIKAGKIPINNYDNQFAERWVEALRYGGEGVYKNYNEGSKTFSCMIRLSDELDDDDKKKCIEALDLEKVIDCINEAKKNDRVYTESGYDKYWVFSLQKDYEHIGVMVGITKNIEKTGTMDLLQDRIELGIEKLNRAFYDFGTGECCTFVF